MLRRIRYGDEYFLFKLMSEDKDNAKYSVPSSLEKWRKLVEWSVKSGDKDLYWIITSDGEDCGYIGFSDAKNKLTMKSLSPENSLFLEIYLLEQYRGKGLAKKSYVEAKSKLKGKKIFASTYITNIKAQKFFIDSLNMKLSHYYKNISVILVDID